MGVFAGPEITSDGLVLALDVGNSKGFDDDENLLAYSEDFSNAYWTKSNVSVTANAIASPTGSSNASKLVESASTAVHELFRSDGALSVGTDTYITFSIFAKAAERQYCYIRSAGNSKRIAVVVDLSNGTFNVTNFNSFSTNSSATVTAYPNGWYRITATSQSNYPQAPGWAGQFIVSPIDSYQLSTTVGGGGYSYAGNGTSGIYIWGAHYEFGPEISDYYATTGTAKTRGTTLIDMTGRGNNGTLTNGPIYSRANGGSLVFDGTNDYVTTGFTRGTLGNQTTLISWYRYTGASARTYSPIFGGIESNGSGTEFFIGKDTGNTNIGIQDGSYNGSFLTGSNAFDGNYHQIAYTYDNGTGKIYLDGTLRNTGSFTKCNDSEQIAIGVELEGGGYYFIGNISQVSIYTRVLSAQEIQQNYNALKRRFTTEYEYELLTYTTTGNLTVTGNGTNTVNIFKTSGGNAWDNQAYSTTPFTAPCTIEFNKQAASADNGVSYAMIGWNVDPLTNASYDTLDYASFPYRTDGYQIYHNGSAITPGISWSTANKFYIVYGTDGFIKHYNGSKLLYSVNYGTGNTVYVDSSFYSPNATFGGFDNIKVIRSAWNGTDYVR